jgi:divalent metal cation (Fe/Co/Zn/Cd) transporter
VKAESFLALVIALVVIAAAGTLFWKLVKSMARIQMPERPGADR